MNRVTPRIPINKNLYNLIGRILHSNCFPTMKGRLVGINNERCYFEIMENEDSPKYNHCAGQIEYLPSHMVISMEFEEE